MKVELSTLPCPALLPTTAPPSTAFYATIIYVSSSAFIIVTILIGTSSPYYHGTDGEIPTERWDFLSLQLICVVPSSLLLLPLWYHFIAAILHIDCFEVNFSMIYHHALLLYFALTFPPLIHLLIDTLLSSIHIRAPYRDSISSSFVSSAMQAGIKFTSDFNDPDGREGVGHFHFNIKGKSS